MQRELNFHDPGRLSVRDYYELFAMPLQRVFIEINQRGVAIDAPRMAILRSKVVQELQSHCQNIQAYSGGKTVISQAPPKAKPDPTVFNLSSTPQVLEFIRGLGMKPPKQRRQDGTYSESANEESLNELFAETGHPFLKELLRVRELNKLLGTYIDVELEANTLYGSFFVTGTVTGRRSCRENFLGLGSNLQNQPKHTDLAEDYRQCLIARPGRIFVKCDQISAEDWLVQGFIADLSGDRRGFEELLNHDKIDRHARLGSQLFNKPVEQCGKNTPERFIGKKVRHAGNYDMEAFRFSQVMASEGHVVTQSFCEWMLSYFHSMDPGIKQVYHRYVQDQMIQTRCLTTPFGFTRQFFGLRDYGDNKKLFKEGFAQIPQGTVGQNTGFAILWLETNRSPSDEVIIDEHDAITLECADNAASVWAAVQRLQTAFNRVIRLPKGLEFTIPIEVELGYNLRDMRTVKCANLNETGVLNTYNGLKPHPSPREAGICGQPVQSSQVPSSATFG